MIICGNSKHFAFFVYEVDLSLFEYENQEWVKITAVRLLAASVGDRGVGEMKFLSYGMIFCGKSVILESRSSK